MVPPAKETPGSAGGMERPGGGGRAVPPPAPPPAGIGCPCGTGAAIGRGSCQSRAAGAGLVAGGGGALCVCVFVPRARRGGAWGGASPRGAAWGEGCGALPSPPLSAEHRGGTQGKLRHGQGRGCVVSPPAHSGDASRCPPVSPSPGGASPPPRAGRDPPAGPGAAAASANPTPRRFQVMRGGRGGCGGAAAGRRGRGPGRRGPPTPTGAGAALRPGGAPPGHPGSGRGGSAWVRG